MELTSGLVLCLLGWGCWGVRMLKSGGTSTLTTSYMFSCNFYFEHLASKLYQWFYIEFSHLRLSRHPYNIVIAMRKLAQGQTTVTNIISVT